MAVETRNLNLFSPQQLVPNSEILNPLEANMNLYNPQMGFSLPLSETTTETMIQAYNSWIVDSVPVKSDSGLTYNLPVQRKRTRDSLRPFLPYKSTTPPQPQKNSISFSFLGEDISLEIQRQQLDVDCIIAQHMAKVRMEVEEKRKRQARRMLEAIELGVMKKLKTKDEEIDKMGELNWALEERVKSLCIENQIWRDLAQTHEATAHALRTNLEQVLAQVKHDRTHGMGLDDELPIATAAFMDDAQSCCGSNDDIAGSCRVEEREVTEEMRILAGGVHGKCKEDEVTIKRHCSHGSTRLCRSCGKEECCVLILPCRHLCLCTVCGSTLHTCPVCKSIKNASVHVNLS